MASVLNSWKEISAYLGAAVRTVQRWETDLGMPVYRTSTSHRGPVIAYASELDSWLRTPKSRAGVRDYFREDMRVNTTRLILLRTRLKQLMQSQRLLVTDLWATRALLRKKKAQGVPRTLQPQDARSKPAA